MKKLLALLSVLMLLSLPACAQSAYTALWEGARLFALSYDGGDLRLDTESYRAGSGAGHIWLGTLYNGSYTIEMGADRYADLPADCTAEQLSDYLCGALQGGGTALEVYPAGGFSFALLAVNGAWGKSYYAAALSQGCVVHFEIYNLRGGVDASALTALKTLLNGVSR